VISRYRHLASVQPLREEDAAANGGLMVSAIAADTAARLLAARFASSAARGAAELAHEVADASTDGAASVRRVRTVVIVRIRVRVRVRVSVRVRVKVNVRVQVAYFNKNYNFWVAVTLAQGCRQPYLAMRVHSMLARCLTC